MDMNELVKLFAPEGVWAMLSVALIFYILKSQEKRDQRQDEREKKYQDIIADLSDALKDLNEIKELLHKKISN